MLGITTRKLATIIRFRTKLFALTGVVDGMKYCILALLLFTLSGCVKPGDEHRGQPYRETLDCGFKLKTFYCPHGSWCYPVLVPMKPGEVAEEYLIHRGNFDNDLIYTECKS
jgi:hypothetical protein